MAFTFVVEDGAGDSDANSYSTVEFADDYIESNTFASENWLALDEDVKERLLVRASKIIDRRVRWVGQRYDQDSGLKWPRAGAYDEDGYLIPDNVIPAVLKEVVAEFASYLVTDDWTAPQQTEGLREIQVDVIDLKLDSTYVRAAFPDIVATMIVQSGLGTVDDGTQKTAFKRIRRT